MKKTKILDVAENTLIIIYLCLPVAWLFSIIKYVPPEMKLNLIFVTILTALGLASVAHRILSNTSFNSL